MKATLEERVRELILIDRAQKQMESLRRTLISVRSEEKESNRQFPLTLEPIIEDLNDHIHCLERCSQVLGKYLPGSFTPNTKE